MSVPNLSAGAARQQGNWPLLQPVRFYRTLLLGTFYQERGKSTCTWILSLCMTCFARVLCLKLTGKTIRGGEDLMQLEGVTGRGRFIIFVAFQGEGRNANVKVGTISSFNTKSPPKQKYKMRSMLHWHRNNRQCIIFTLNCLIDEGETSKLTTYVHSGPVKTHGCCIGKLVVLSIKPAPETRNDAMRLQQICY